MHNRTQRSHLTEQDLADITRYVRSNISERLSVESLASVLGISASCFARLFKQTTASTPHHFVLEQRIEAAKAMLEHDPEVSIASIAARAGFSDQAHLTRTFRKTVGQTPGEFAAANSTPPR